MMSVRLRLVVPDAADAELDRAAQEGNKSKAKVMRTALALYLLARGRIKLGQKLALLDRRSGKLETEIVGP
jgi:hypothetical protein